MEKIKRKKEKEKDKQTKHRMDTSATEIPKCSDILLEADVSNVC